MTTENDGSDADLNASDFFDEGVAEAGIEVEAEPDATGHEPAGVMAQDKTEDVKGADDDTGEALQQAIDATGDEKDKGEPEEEPGEEPDSIIEGLLPDAGSEEEKPASDATEDADPEGRVPVADHIKLRQRAQTAEKELDDLKKKLETSDTPTGEEKPGTQEVSPLKQWVADNPDELDIPPAVQIANDEWRDAREEAKDTARRKEVSDARQAAEAAVTRSTQATALSTSSKASEKAARKAHADYDAVVKSVLAVSPLTDAESDEMFGGDKPDAGEALYQICQKKREALKQALGVATTEPGTAPQAAQQKVSEGDEPMSDEEVEAYLESGDMYQA